MLPEYQEYYQLLLADLHCHENEKKAEMEMIEACFRSSLDCWGKVNNLARKNGFRDESEEIGFFREAKPSFGACLEYYTFRYHALLFSPVDNSGFLPGHTGPDPESCHTCCLLLEHSSCFGVPNSRRIFVVALSGSTGLLGILCSISLTATNVFVYLSFRTFISSCERGIPAVCELLSVCAGQRVWRVMR